MSQLSQPGMVAADQPPPPPQQQQKQPPKQQQHPVKTYLDSIGARLSATPPAMSTSVRLLDEQLQWCGPTTTTETGATTLGDYLSDETASGSGGGGGGGGFLVVGVIGRKGTGKSTLASRLAHAAGRDNDDDQTAESVFRSAASSSSGHCTSGVSAFITCERTILLDVQVCLTPIA